MKKSLNNPTNFMFYLLLSVVVSYTMKVFIFTYRETSVDILISIVVGLLLSLIPFLISDTIAGLKNHNGTLINLDGLPGYSITFKHASKKPTVTASKKGLTTIVNFGNGTLFISRVDTDAISVTYHDNLAFLVQNQNKNVKVFVGDWE